MGPQNLALVDLFRADQSLREAVRHLESITHEVRTQETRNAQTSARLAASQTRLKELQSKSANLELDLKMREEHIEKLRSRQASAANNKEYQALLVEINTAKVDRAKVEEMTFKLMEQVETVSTEVKNVGAILAGDEAKLAELRAKVGDKAAAAQAEVDRLRPARNEAAAKVAASSAEKLSLFDKLADRYDGEALAAIDKPNPREEEYLCLGCNMGLVADVFNKLKGKDDVVQCPSCKRMLYIPDTLVRDAGSAKKTRAKSERKVTRVVKPASEVVVAPSKWDRIVTAAQGESVEGAKDADHKPVECKVEINGEAVGTFRGKSADHLERVIRLRLEEDGIAGAEVKVIATEAAQEPAAQS